MEEWQVAVPQNKIHKGEKEMSDDLYRSLVGRNKKIGKISAGGGFGSNVPGKKRKKKKKKGYNAATYKAPKGVKYNKEAATYTKKGKKRKK